MFVTLFINDFLSIGSFPSWLDGRGINQNSFKFNLLNLSSLLKKERKKRIE